MPCARHPPVTRPATNRLVQSFGALLPAHWGPQAPLSAAPPLARELEARVAVAGKACGLSGQLQNVGTGRSPPVADSLVRPSVGLRDGMERRKEPRRKRGVGGDGNDYSDSWNTSSRLIPADST